MTNSVEDHEQTTTTVRVSGGELRGTVSGGISSFKGIPFAAPPVGELRFERPQPPASWDGVRDATEYGPTAPQGASASEVSELLSNVIIPGDDHLNLNVWSGDLEASRPVMVFIHGGAFTTGSGAVPAYDGSNFARDGVVLVTINYRLGAEGFLWFGEGTPNLGMLDQVAALQWVRDNIRSFGGDPERVTIFGESAGGMSVCTLIAMPEAKGLFHRAIAQSGAGHSVINPATAQLIGRRMAAILGIEPTREAFAAVPVEQVVAAQLQVGAEISAKPRARLWGEVAQSFMPFQPIVDGTILPEYPHRAIKAGAGHDIEILLGTNTDETRLFFAPSGAVDTMKPLFVRIAAMLYKAPARTVKVYGRNRPGATPGDIFCLFITDWMYRIPAIRIAESHPASHLYEFTWRTPALNGVLGACHALEIAFVFDNLDAPDVARTVGEHPPTELAAAMHRAWLDFAVTGDPGWERYSAERRVSMSFGDQCGATVDDRAEELALWDGRRR